MARAKKVIKKNGTDSIVRISELTRFKQDYDAEIIEAMALKQDKTDDALETSSKVIVGAINEINAKTGSAYHFKGSVEKKADLPTEGQVEGDVYNISGEDQPDYGMNYA